MNDRTIPPFQWSFFVQWTLATTAGWLVGGYLGEPAIGLFIGLAQWVVLRSLPDAYWWVIGSALGWLAGYALIVFLLPQQVGLMASFVLGLGIGLGQWLVLRRWFARTVLWLPVSAAAWFLGLSPFPGFFLVGAMVGGITGIPIELFYRVFEYRGLTAVRGRPRD